MILFCYERQSNAIVNTASSICKISVKGRQRESTQALAKSYPRESRRPDIPLADKNWKRSSDRPKPAKNTHRPTLDRRVPADPRADSFSPD